MLRQCIPLGFLSDQHALKHLPTADHEMRERPLRKTFMHMMRSRHPSLSAQELLTLIRHAIMPDEDDDDDSIDDLSEDMALHLAMV